ncbi:DNA polymerase alpha subunit B isoform X2 [Eublepharis macularius]|uniref:DNA polymerase alpha subunit B n=1 Tax=Eublepharis macularius TaxID=481883 RepID=A0AA97JIE7_EUBMA|nr:DNA polymerase alpha subunit B isoform X2 [Eublepharis macularius]
MLHRLKETDVADELVAFAAGKKIFLLTADFLNIFEHEALNKRSAKSHKRKENCYSGVRDINTIQELLDVEEEEENLLDAYAITPSKSSQKRAITTPENPRSKRTLSTRSPHLVFSPNSFSPSATPSQKYSSRGNRGEVVTSFGSAQGTVWSGNGGMSTSAKLFGPAEDSLTKRYKFMFQKLLDNREVLSYKIEELGEALKEHYQIEEFSSLNVPAQEPVAVLGQIGCDSNGKLNARSVILEGDREHSSGGQIPVDVSELVEYSLFPGQVVVMEGTNSTGGQLVASKLYEGVPLPFHKPTSPTEEPEQQMVLVACGPYTTSDSMTYDPIVDLIEVINKSRPDICILLGPFVDAKHTQVERVLFVSDPCTLEINGVVFGLTSTDLLFHMGAEEISSSSSILDRFSRILKHVLTQRSYYPLYPPVEEINIDYENFYHHAHLPVTPDVLITPSDLRYFIKDILGCICMNPGRLTKGQVGGTYGRLYVRQQVSRDERKSPCIAAQVVRI